MKPYALIPLAVTPRAEDRAALETARARLNTALARMDHCRRAYRAGRATPAMLEHAIAEKHLARVLEGPRALYRLRK